MAIKIVGLSGKAGSGKDYIAREVLQPLGFSPVALADQLKTTAIGRGLASYNEVYHTKPPHVRETLQQLGTELGRNVYGEDVWVRSLSAWMQIFYERWGIDRFVITDVRFPNEIKFLHTLGAVVYRIQAPARADNNGLSPELRTHISEIALDREHDLFDGFVPNDPGDGELMPTVVKILLRSHGMLAPASGACR
jgi:hypothetical protein